MEDVLTEAPPPSRFFLEDLNNFTPQSPPLPSPFILFSNPESPIRASLLIIAISPPSLRLLHHFSSKTLIGALILPETPFSGTTISPSSTDKSCNIYAIDDQASVLLVLVQCVTSDERAHAVAKLLIERICAGSVLVLGSVQSRNFRGKLAPDEALGFKMETVEQRVSEPLVKGLEYFPSGSVVDGLAAAVLSRCELMRVTGTLCVTWPESGGLAVGIVKSLLRDVLPDLEFGSGGALGFGLIRDSRADSEMYT